jgi:hypothetical protein
MGVRSTGSYPTTTSADGHLLRYYREDMGVGGGARGVFSSSGGTVFTIGNYKYHVFASGADNFTASNIDGVSVDVLAVGGGGAGSPSMGAGGGGGGLVYHESADGGVFDGTNIITVGGGGTKISATASGLPGNNGTDTTIGSLYTAMGGGGAGRYSPTVSPGGSPISFPAPSVVTTPSPFGVNDGNRGGSGGGGGGSTGGTGGASLQTTYAPLPANSITYGFGFAGGNTTTYSNDNYYSRAGGGGAGGAGGNNRVTPLGSGLESWGWGGNGKNLPASFMDPGFPAPVIAALGGVPTSSPEWVYFAGGGGAGSNGGPPTAGPDGNGKNRGGLGNNTGPSSTYEYGYGSHTGSGVDGCPGRGGGGGGGVWSTGEGGSGGGGCVIIRILLS